MIFKRKKTTKPAPTGNYLKYFNQQEHPEKKSYEIWVVNTTPEMFKRLSFKTKRSGKIAYNKYGRVLKGIIPVFIRKLEYNRIKTRDADVH